MKPAAELEEEHVRRVYDGIAQHFSNTRYKAWPVVKDFIMRLPAGSVGVDVGCGNGKNMLIRTGDIYCIGFDLYPPKGSSLSIVDRQSC